MDWGKLGKAVGRASVNAFASFSEYEARESQRLGRATGDTERIQRAKEQQENAKKIREMGLDYFSDDDEY